MTGGEAVELVPHDAAAGARAEATRPAPADLTVDAFVAAVLDCEHYPLDATYLGAPALTECRTLERRPDGTEIVYQRAGGSAFASERQMVLAIRVAERTTTRARVEWDLVRHAFVDGRWQGPYADVLATHPAAIWTPYNVGAWWVDTASHTLGCAVQVDLGGALPAWMTRPPMLLAFPLSLFRSRWDVSP